MQKVWCVTVLSFSLECNIWHTGKKTQTNTHAHQKGTSTFLETSLFLNNEKVVLQHFTKIFQMKTNTILRHKFKRKSLLLKQTRRIPIWKHAVFSADLLVHSQNAYNLSSININMLTFEWFTNCRAAIPSLKNSGLKEAKILNSLPIQKTPTVPLLSKGRAVLVCYGRPHCLFHKFHFWNEKNFLRTLYINFVFFCVVQGCKDVQPFLSDSGWILFSSSDKTFPLPVNFLRIYQPQRHQHVFVGLVRMSSLYLPQI